MTQTTPDTATPSNTFLHNQFDHPPSASCQSDRITTMLIDDHLLFRESLCSILATSPNIDIIGASGDGRESLRLIGRLQPRVVILDISMPGLGGLDLAPRIREISPKTEILMLSMHDNSNYVYRAFKAGCRGYALKSDSAESLHRAIAVVARGETYLSPGIASDFIDHLLNRAEMGDSPASLLTPREQEICHLVAQGRTTDQLAADLCISPKTVRVHVANVMKKFSCQSRIELALRLQQMDNI
ncbi:MAG: response regulator transcription factor [Desulfobulbaceae bacterium]|nr:response regulator transcription factor [Desulfobulbaceae bacterium]